MSRKQTSIIYKGRNMGIIILTAAQILIGVIHVFSGLLLFSYELKFNSQISISYDVYTFVFGLIVLVFAVFIWQGKKAGWVGTFAVSMFVIAVDSLTLLDLPSIPGIPKVPALTEILYSLLVIFYLLQWRIRRKYLGKSAL
jgi:hypothetical protein